jgi:very-short-patch-repair endonuclease
MTSPQAKLARELRRKMTRVEWLLWSRLSGRQLGGYKFRRQAPIGPYVVDFYCPAARLIIEIDGPHHDKRRVEDEQRRRYFEGEAFRLVRFTVDQPPYQLDRVLARILQECQTLMPKPPSRLSERR